MTHPLLAGFPSIVELDVAWGDMDSLGHVNNVVYFRYFENARVEYFTRLDWWESLKEKADARTVAAKLSATAREEVFDAGIDGTDIGDGFLTAPE